MGWVLKSKENIKKHSTNKRDDKPGHNKLSELPQDIMKGPQEICESAGSHETETESQALVFDKHTWTDCGWEPRPKAAICELMAKWGGALKMPRPNRNLI